MATKPETQPTTPENPPVPTAPRVDARPASQVNGVHRREDEDRRRKMNRTPSSGRR